MKKRAPSPFLRVATVAALVVGLGLTLPFDQTLPLVAGVLALLAFIVLGVFLIANPEDLDREEDEL